MSCVQYRCGSVPSWGATRKARLEAHAPVQADLCVRPRRSAKRRPSDAAAADRAPQGLTAPRRRARTPPPRRAAARGAHPSRLPPIGASEGARSHPPPRQAPHPAARPRRRWATSTRINSSSGLGAGPRTVSCRPQAPPQGRRRSRAINAAAASGYPRRWASLTGMGAPTGF